jgi:hypothetical protein
MPTRLTQHQRKIRKLQVDLEREITLITLQELQRLWRDFRIKLRRLEAQRPFSLQKGEHVVLQKDAFYSRDLYAQFRERTHKRVKKAAEATLIAMAALYGAHTLAVTGKAFAVDVAALMRQFETELSTRLTRITTNLQKIIATRIGVWYNNHEETTANLIEKLEPQFGESKANGVGRTEVALLAVAVLTAVAVGTGAREWWLETKRDELVCSQRIKGPDGATYRGCRAMHGMVFPITAKKPPLHPLCRCHWHIIYPGGANGQHSR